MGDFSTTGLGLPLTKAMVDAKFDGIVSAGVGNGNLYHTLFDTLAKASEDGSLAIEARAEKFTGTDGRARDYTSARLKTKGKAAVDVVGNPLGKSGGALIQQFLIFGVGSLAAAGFRGGGSKDPTKPLAPPEDRG